MTLSPASPRARRRTAIAAAFALVAGLLTFGAPLSATANEIGTGPGSISGTATNIDGQPVEGVFVGASVSFGEGTAFWAYTYTDAAGHYEFTELALDHTYVVTASLFGFQPAPAQSVSLTAESVSATANFEILPFPVGVGTISGYITGDGVPIVGKGVSASENFSGQSVNVVTDENGFYQFTGLPNGQWHVGVWGDPQYQPIFGSSVTLTDGAPTATVDFPFLSWPVGTASITGVVTDSATGEPLVDVQVSVFGHDVAHSSHAWTDETGAFIFDLLPEGTYGLNFYSFGYLRAPAEVQTVADQSVTVDRALVAADATISGRVVDENGAPVVGYYVDAHDQNSNSGGDITDENGDYVLTGLGAGDWTLSIGGGAYDRQVRVVSAVAAADVTANFTLVTRTTGSLGGMVFGPDGEYYSAPVCVTLYSAKNKKPLAEVATYGENYGDGTFSFDNLNPGTYTVEFRDCDNDPATKFDKVFLGGVKNFKDATIVTVVAGQNTWDNSVTLTVRGNN